LSSGQRNVLGDEKRSCGHFAWEVAARGGAAALGQATGTIEPGRRADLVELNPDHPLLAGKRFDEVLDGLVFAEAAGMIRCVLTAGRVRVSDGRHSARESCASAMRATLAELRTNAP
jgi:formimidoylglutamate deiminase